MGLGGVLGAIGIGLKGITGVLSFVPTVISIVEMVSKIIGKSKIDSKTKKELAIEMVREAISGIEGFSGKDIVDQELFTEGLGHVIDGMVDCMNASVWYKK